MTQALEIQVGEFHWTHSSWFHADEDFAELDEPAADCATCPNSVTAGQPYWYCDENGEVVHETCQPPTWN
jgi:hypothetical protein